MLPVKPRALDVGKFNGGWSTPAPESQPKTPLKADTLTVLRSGDASIHAVTPNLLGLVTADFLQQSPFPSRPAILSSSNA